MEHGKYAKYVNELVPNVDPDRTHTGKITQLGEWDNRFFEAATHHIESYIVSKPGFGFHDGGIAEPVIINGIEVRDLPFKIPWDEISLFIGTDPENRTDLGGEVEFWFGEGEDAEKYIITKPSCVLCPAGLVHLPVYFRKVHRPFMFIVIIPSSLEPGPYMRFAEGVPPGFKR